MEFGFSKEQEEFRQEIHEFCASALKGESAKVDLTTSQAHSPEFYRKAAEKGFIGVNFPKEYGGRGLGCVELTIFHEEMAYQRAPISLSSYGTSVNLAGAIIAEYGSEKLKKDFLTRLTEGEIWITQCFTESEASSDLAEIKTQAIKQGDYYVINGQKMFTSGAHRDPYAILMAKTNPQAPPRNGISLFTLDLKSPGITITPLKTISGVRTNQVFLDDVKIPADYLIGEENHGWEYFSSYRYRYWNRRQGLFAGTFRRVLEDLIKYVKETKRDGKPLNEDPLVRQKIAQLAIEVESLRLLTYRLAWAEDKKLDVLGCGAIFNAFVNELAVTFPNRVMQILGLGAQLERGEKYAPFDGSIEDMYLRNFMRLFSSGGILGAKNFIATHNLGMPQMYEAIY